MKRPFEEYFNEAVEKGWWRGADVPHEDSPPRVLIECGGNVLRRTRGGSRRLLEHLWPQLKKIVTIDVRMSATALHSDIVLPAAQQYEKLGFGIPSSHVMNLTFCDKAVDPPGEALQEWEIFRRIAEKVEERAKERGFEPYKDSRNRTYDPKKLHETFTSSGEWLDQEVIFDEMLRDTAMVGTIPENASLEDLREKGFYRWQGLGLSARQSRRQPNPSPTRLSCHFASTSKRASRTRRFAADRSS